MKIIFVDRDGVINRDPDEITDKRYVTKWEEFQFLPGVLDALRQLTQEGYKIVIISNQAGVGKGIYTKERLDEITGKMLEQIEANGGKIHSVQYCIHEANDNCECRKPKTGLFKMAAEGLDIDFTKTYFIGDTKRDIEAGKRIGCRTVLVLCGKTKNKREIARWKSKPHLVVKDLAKAVKIIIKKAKS